MGVSGFQGISTADQEPPDQALCVGKIYVMEAVNLYIRIRTRDGTILADWPFEDFIGWGLTADYLTDPICLWDPSDQAFYWAAANTDPYYSLLVVARESADILALDGWTRYIQTVSDATPDYPKIGSDFYGFYVSTYKDAGTASSIANEIWMLSKQLLLAGPSATLFPKPRRVSFPISGITQIFIPARVQDSQTAAIAGAGVEYLVRSTLTGSTVEVMAVLNTSALGQTSTSSGVVVDIGKNLRSVTVTPYQLGAFNIQQQLLRPNVAGCNTDDVGPFAGGDETMMQVTWSNQRLYFAWGTRVIDSSMPEKFRAAAQYAVVRPALQFANPTASNFSVSLEGQGVVDTPNGHLIYPAIGVNSAGKGVVVAGLVSRTYFPSVAFFCVDAFAGPSGIIQVVGVGQGLYDGMGGAKRRREVSLVGANRYGDYFATALDPVDRSIWIAAEYVPEANCNNPNWGTYIVRVNQNMCPYFAAPSPSPTHTAQSTASRTPTRSPSTPPTAPSPTAPPGTLCVPTVRLTEVTQTTMSFEWSCPAGTTAGSWELVCRCDENFRSIMSGPTRTATLVRLDPGDDYDCTLQAFTGPAKTGNKGPLITVQGTTTLPAITPKFTPTPPPGGLCTPDIADEVTVSATSMAFAWDCPDYPDTYANTWRVTCFDPKGGKFLAVFPQDPPQQSDMEFKMTGLKSGTKYNCTLAACADFIGDHCGAPQQLPITSTTSGGGIHGEPHVTTFDGLTVTYPDCGDYIMTTDFKGFSMHARFCTKSSQYITNTCAVALKCGRNTSKAEVYTLQNSAKVFIDGKEHPLKLGKVKAKNLQVIMDAGKVKLACDRGPWARVYIRTEGDGWYIDVLVRRGKFRRAVRGLLGNANGIMEDDIVGRDWLVADTRAREYIFGPRDMTVLKVAKTWLVPKTEALLTLSAKASEASCRRSKDAKLVDTATQLAAEQFCANAWNDVRCGDASTWQQTCFTDYVFGSGESIAQNSVDFVGGTYCTKRAGVVRTQTGSL